MKIIVNGDEHTTEKGTLAELLAEMEIPQERVAVEVNLRVIKKKDLGSFTLSEGDRIEIVYFVGGGQA